MQPTTATTANADNDNDKKADKPNKPNKPKPLVQPVEAASNPDALLRQHTVSALVGLQRSSIYEKVRQGTFPQPLKLGARCTRWRARDVVAWLKTRG